jgi:tRNA(fMet)-specific endonuclease VapC
VKYLVDSDWIIEALRNRPGARALISTLSVDGVAVSVVTFAEVAEGAYLSANPVRELAAVRRFLDGFRIVNVTPSVATRFARERANLRRSGTPIADMDLLIAATALR